MQTTLENPVIQKTRELCQTILEQPDFKSIRVNIDAFLSDEQAKSLYQTVVEKSETLNHKQQMGAPLTPEEIADFESQRQALVNNPVARGFMDAQGEMHRMQESVQQYVTKTLELGRVPNEDDFSSGSCGHGCGCHH